MIKKLDLYIAKKFFSTFFFVCLMFTLIAVSIDYIEKVGKYIEHDLSSGFVIKEYVLNFILWINILLWPLFLLISIILFTSRMAYKSEIISILNAGVSFRRIMLTYLTCTALIAALHYWCNHYLVPQANKTRLKFENTYIFSNEEGKTRDIQMFTAPNEKIYLRYYRKKDTTGLDFRLERFDGIELKYLLNAKRIKWIEEPNRWKITDYSIRTFEGEDETLTYGSGLSMDTILNIHPSDFIRYNNEKHMLTSREMNQFIQREKERGLDSTHEFKVEKAKRSAEPFSLFLLCIIGLSIASRKIRGGTGLHIAIGIGIGVLMILMTKFSTTFADGGNFPILLAIWMPNVLFSIISIYLINKAQK